MANGERKKYLRVSVDLVEDDGSPQPMPLGGKTWSMEVKPGVNTSDLAQIANVIKFQIVDKLHRFLA